MNSLGDRMKDYEKCHRYFLTKRTPVILRLDGRAFHSITRNFTKPFSNYFISLMGKAAAKVCEEIQGFKLAYVQSDEASFLFTDFDDINTQGWFGYNHSKIISIASSVMSVYFNKYSNNVWDAVFDGRAFNVPERDVANYFLWRSQDWERNSLQMYCQSFFSHEEMQHKTHKDLHDMLHAIGKNWTTDLKPIEKNGTFMYKLNNTLIADGSIKPNFTQIDNLIQRLF